MTNPQPTSWSEVLVAQSCPTLCYSMDCSPPGSSVHGILQARILEWVAITFSRGSSWPRDWTQASCIAGRFFTAEPPGETLANIILNERKKNPKSIFFKIRKKTRTTTLTTFVQHSIGSPGHTNKARKRNFKKSKLEWSKTVIAWDDIRLYRKS